MNPGLINCLFEDVTFARISYIYVRIFCCKILGNFFMGKDEERLGLGGFFLQSLPFKSQDVPQHLLNTLLDPDTS